MKTSKKRYPDHKRVRRQVHLACHAIQELAEMGIEVISVKFRPSNPKIEVAHCPGTRNLRSAYTGQGVDDLGQSYIRRASAFCGCHVEWHERRA